MKKTFNLGVPQESVLEPVLFLIRINGTGIFCKEVL